MLAATAKSYEDLRFPLLCTPKLDGIRCVKVFGNALSRSFKPIPNDYIRSSIERCLPDGVDGELMTPGDYNDTQSAVMSRDGTPDFYFAIFDRYIPRVDYWDRVQLLDELPRLPWMQLVLPTLCDDLPAFQAFEAQCLEQGYEGVMGRSARGPYKFGRSSLSEHWLVKWKRFHDSEAVVLGYREGRTNLNPQVPNAFGYAKRPGGGALVVPRGTFGGFDVRDVHTGVEFHVGSGFADALRAEIWKDPASYVGRVVKYRCQLAGAKDRPRFPRFVGFRHVDDVGAAGS